MPAYDVRVQIRENGREIWNYARSLEVDESTGLGKYEKAPAVLPTSLPLSVLDTLQLLLVQVDQDDCLITLGTNLRRGGFMLVCGAEVTLGVLQGLITYNGTDPAQVAVLGGGT